MSGSITPMMEQYWRVKSRHPDKIVFFRLGDFYEMFYEDAERVSRELELTLTARENKGGRIPMCGVPYQSAETYIARLIERGYKIVLCDQVEDARQARGLVRREVVRVITPGTVVEAAMLDERRNNYLAAWLRQGDGWALAAADVSTGQCLVAAESGAEAAARLRAEVDRLAPAECLAPESQVEDLRRWAGDALRTVTPRPDHDFDPRRARELVTEVFGPAACNALLEGAAGGPAAGGGSTVLRAVGGLLAYLADTQGRVPANLEPPRVVRASEYLVLDAAARRHLELVGRSSDGSRRDTLLGVLDRTVTAMGARCLRSWVEQPLVSRPRIEARLDAVEALVRAPAARQRIREALRGVHDLERLASRVAFGTANARDLVALRRSLQRLPALQAELAGLEETSLLGDLLQRLDPLPDLADLLERALVDDPPASLTEGGLLRDGYDARVDELRLVAREGRSWVTRLEQRERERTGIKSLKVGFNKVFGYYLEITHANRDRVPPDYQRRQTLANAERYITPELKEIEDKILGAEERLNSLEYEVFLALREQVAARLDALRRTASAVAEVDTLAALAEVADQHGYVRPELSDDLVLEIEDGRHPVLDQRPDAAFVPNDTRLDGRDRRMMVLTGPNMGGKSTYLRQVALIVIMAQMGSFVPARRARIGLVDRIFTRIGAADDLARGESTFMVEIREALQVLLYATPRSLAIIDELGRGTSTYDGIAFSTAYLEYLHRHVGCRTLLSTHFFELTRLAERLPGVHNHHVQALLDGERLVFSYRVLPGAADRSYGVEVARSAGMPTELVLRARELLLMLEQGERAAAPGAAGLGSAAREAAAAQPGDAGTLPGGSAAQPGGATGPGGGEWELWRTRTRAVLETLAGTDIMHLTPLQAMERLQVLAEQARLLVGWLDGENLDAGGAAGRP
ncbi:MAG: DNA mismatch repair protein MutS [Bacillota bacterium]